MSEEKKVPNLIEVLFKGVNGSLPLVLYVAPVFIWVMLFMCIGLDTQAMAREITEVAASNMLQEDINLISEKVKDSGFFKMSKEDIIKSSQNDNFLLQKAKKKIEKSLASKSIGLHDENRIEFDSSLNLLVEEAEENLETAEDSTVLNALDYEMKQMKTDRTFNYEQKKKEIELAERERKSKIEQAIEDNRRKRTAKEKEAYEEYQLEKEAYEQSVYAYHNNGDPTKGGAPPPSSRVSKAKAAKPKFGFQTAIGLKDDFSLYDKDKAAAKRAALRADSIQQADQRNRLEPRLMNDANNIANQIPLYATIDQARKVRSGQKVQIRILEDGFYRGLYIPANSIVYGLCSINNNRINIVVPSIQYNNEIIRTNMIAYDMDGIQGVYVDGTFNDLTRDFVNEGLRAGSTLGLSSARNPLGNLSVKFGRKANNRVSVHIPSGYSILLYHGAVKEDPLNRSYNDAYNTRNPLRTNTFRDN